MRKERSDQTAIDLLQGTLDMLILRTLLFGPQHGYGIGQAIQQTSGDVLRVDHGSLYPALQRLQRRGWIRAAWATSENNRRAKYYRLTPTGRKQLVAETTQWKRLVQAITGVLRPRREEG